MKLCHLWGPLVSQFQRRLHHSKRQCRGLALTSTSPLRQDQCAPDVLMTVACGARGSACKSWSASHAKSWYARSHSVHRCREKTSSCNAHRVTTMSMQIDFATSHRSNVSSMCEGTQRLTRRDGQCHWNTTRGRTHSLRRVVRGGTKRRRTCELWRKRCGGAATSLVFTNRADLLC